MIDRRATEQITPYLERALRGASHEAARVALDLLDTGVPEGNVIGDSSRPRSSRSVTAGRPTS